MKHLDRLAFLFLVIAGVCYLERAWFLPSATSLKFGSHRAELVRVLLSKERHWLGDRDCEDAMLGDFYFGVACWSGYDEEDSRKFAAVMLARDRVEQERAFRSCIEWCNERRGKGSCSCDSDGSMRWTGAGFLESAKGTEWR